MSFEIIFFFFYFFEIIYLSTKTGHVYCDRIKEKEQHYSYCRLQLVFWFGSKTELNMTHLIQNWCILRKIKKKTTTKVPGAIFDLYIMQDTDDLAILMWLRVQYIRGPDFYRN